MTVYKKHMTPDGESRICTAKVKCPYGGESQHFYYDSSIGEPVLNPSSPMQKAINRIPSADLLERGGDYLPPEADRTLYNHHHDVLAKRTEEYNAQKEAIIKSYPVKHQRAARLLTTMHEGAGLIAGFDIFDPEEEDGVAKTTATEDQKVKFAQTYMGKFRAEGKLRAAISAANV